MNRQDLHDALDAALREWVKDVPGPCSEDYHGPMGDVYCAARGESLNCCLDHEHEAYEKLLTFVAEKMHEQLVPKDEAHR